MSKRFVYLTPVVDWASKKVPAAKIAITLEAYHAVDVLLEAFNRHGTPEIIYRGRTSYAVPIVSLYETDNESDHDIIFRRLTPFISPWYDNGEK